MKPICKDESWHRGHLPNNGRNAETGVRLCSMVMCPHLDWPLDLFAQNEGMAFMPHEKLTSEFLCACGCQLRHNCAVSSIVSINGDRQVLWYRTMRCLNKHTGIAA
jgi:hypothetical protein